MAHVTQVGGFSTTGEKLQYFVRADRPSKFGQQEFIHALDASGNQIEVKNGGWFKLGRLLQEEDGVYDEMTYEAYEYGSSQGEELVHHVSNALVYDERHNATNWVGRKGQQLRCYVINPGDMFSYSNGLVIGAENILSEDIASARSTLIGKYVVPHAKGVEYKTAKPTESGVVYGRIVAVDELLYVGNMAVVRYDVTP